MIRTLAAANTASNAAVNMASRSRIRNFRPSARSSRFISRLRAWWVTQSAVGWAVIPATCTRRVQRPMKKSTYRRCRNTRVDVEEVRRECGLGLGLQKRAPGLPGSPGCRVGARVFQDLPDRRRRDLVAQAG
jgi:hypothetical protein